MNTHARKTTDALDRPLTTAGPLDTFGRLQYRWARNAGHDARTALFRARDASAAPAEDVKAPTESLHNTDAVAVFTTVREGIFFRIVVEPDADGIADGDGFTDADLEAHGERWQLYGVTVEAFDAVKGHPMGTASLWEIVAGEYWQLDPGTAGLMAVHENRLLRESLDDPADLPAPGSLAALFANDPDGLLD